MSVKKINYSQFEDLPTRSHFLNSALTAKISADIAASADIYFMPNDVYEDSKHMGQGHYRTYIFGNLPDGSKAAVVVEKIPVYFDIRVIPNDSTSYHNDNMMAQAEELKRTLYQYFNTKGLRVGTSEFVTGFRMNEFREEPDVWIRLNFTNLKDRADAIKYISGITTNNPFTGEQIPKYSTSADDTGSYNNNYYYHKVAREYGFNTCYWNVLRGGLYKHAFKHNVNEASQKFRVDHWFYVTVDNYRPISPQEQDKLKTQQWFSRDSAMIMTWDIETYTKFNQNGTPPTPEETNWDIFMICATFHWYHTPNALLKVCLVDVDTAHDEESLRDIFYDKEDINTEARKQKKSIEDIMAKDSKENYLVICGNSKGNQVDPNRERNLLEAFGRLIKRMAPELIVAFNGGGFDWPCVREKLKRYKMLRSFKDNISILPLDNYFDSPDANGETNIHDRSWVTERVKISAEEMHTMLRLGIPGIIDTDCMVIFKQLYTKMEVQKSFSLNYFLKMNKLKGKEDMPYKVMFQIYKAAVTVADEEAALTSSTTAAFIDKLIELGKPAEEIESVVKANIGTIIARKMQPIIHKNLADMAQVAKYCVVDAFRCQQLFVVRTIVQDRREIANDAFVTTFAGFYRAGGMKVRQLVANESFNTQKLIYEGERMRIMYSAAKPSNKKVKYPGAWVFPPKKGLNARRPVVGLDFASLYPNLIITYNMSPEVAIEDRPGAKQYIETLLAKGYFLHRIDFNAEVTDENSPDKGTFFPVGGWCVRHSNVINPGDKVDFQPKGVENPRQGKDPLPREIMAIFPTIQLKLFHDRRVYKKQYVALTTFIEYLSKFELEAKELGVEVNWENIPEKEFAGTGYTKKQVLDILAAGNDPKEEISFARNVVNSKQSSKKVFMNTFYGEQGNVLSSIYKLMVAGGITGAGQYNIKMVAEICALLGYFVSYGDTDSCYISAPEKLFEAVDKIWQDISKAIMDALALLGYKAPVPVYAEIHNEHIEHIALMFTPATMEYRKKYTQLEAKLKMAPDTLEEFNKQNEQDYAAYNRCLLEVANNASASITVESEESEKLKIIDMWKLLYFRAREEYWTIMVQITRRDLTRFTKIIGKVLKDNNGTGYLNMDYEEVLFPVVFTGKKKYFGFAHHETEVFYPTREKIFIKGIDIVKQGQSDLAKEIGFQIIEEVCSVHNTSDMLDLVHEKIKYIYSREWSLSNFVLNAKYKPHKRNIPVNTFVDRMKIAYDKYMKPGALHDPQRAAVCAPPDPGDPFKYVVIKRDQQFDLRGRKVNLKKGDVMEFLSMYEYSQKTMEPMKIDLNYYMEGAIFGLFARFIAYRPEFQPSSVVTDPDIIDETSVKNAVKYIENYTNQLNGIDKAELRKQGFAYRKEVNMINKAVMSDIKLRFGGSVGSVMNNIDVPVIEYSNEQEFNQALESASRATEMLAVDYANKLANDNAVMLANAKYYEADEFAHGVKHLIDNAGDFRDLQALYKIVVKDGRVDKRSRLYQIDQQIEKCKKLIRDASPHVVKILQEYNAMIAELIMDSRERGIGEEDFLTKRIDEIADSFGTDSQLTIEGYYDCIIDLAGWYDCRRSFINIRDKLQDIVNKKAKNYIVAKPQDIPNAGERLQPASSNSLTFNQVDLPEY